VRAFADPAIAWLIRCARFVRARHRIATFVDACASTVIVVASAAAAGVVAAQDRPAAMTPRAAQSVLLGIANAGSRLVAVGERGIVVYSDDAGHSWRQARVPVSVTLTAVRFPTPRDGWAVGHAGVVIHSRDGGETWQRQLTGDAAARLAYEAAAQRRTRGADGDARVAQAVAEAQRLVQDGADKPLLDLHFFDARNGIVVGAYNLIYRTRDAGATWQPLLDRTGNREGLHLYAISALGDRLYIAGEQGLLLRSRDRGETFERVTVPYRGSLFAVLADEHGEVIVAGLRGHAYESRDEGATWRAIDVPVATAIACVARLAGHALLFAGEGGLLVSNHADASPFALVATPPWGPINAVATAPDGAWIVATMRGVARLERRDASVHTARKP
jgi:photosystem II stability/assembly factor-like uncharacterized protein